MRNALHRLTWGTFALGALLALAIPAEAQTTREKYAARRDPSSPFSLAAEGETQFTYNINNWLCGLNDRGQSCVNTFGSTTGGGGFWPIGTANQYVFDFGLQIAARDPLDPAGFNAMHCFNVSATNAACTPASSFYHSDNPLDLANWPDDCRLWNPQTGEYVKTLSQLDVCVKYTDFDPARTVPGGHPMGIEVTQHTLAYTLAGFRDVIFFIYKIKNKSHTPEFKAANPSLAVPPGGWTLQDIYVAVGHDADVSSDEVDENYGTFVPFLNDTTPLWLASIWQADFVAGDFQPYAQCGFCSNPGFVGTIFLRSPYNNTGNPIVNAAAGRTVPPIDQARLEELRLAAARGDLAAQDTLKNYEIGQSFGSLTTRGGVFPDPEDAAQSWRYYSGNLNAQERSQTAGAPPGFGFVDQPTFADTRYFHATGPFNLAPGDSAEVIVGMIAGAPVLDVPGFTPGTVVDHGLPGDTTRLIEKIMGRGRTNTAYPSLFKAALDARLLFETNFLLPNPPPSPTVMAIAGNRQVALTWSDEAVTTPDDYYPLAVQRGVPGYREYDFEGYRVYRRVRPNAPWELIAQFDLNNGLTEVVTPVDTVINQDGEVVVIRADTARAGTDTGLRFALIDRGGKFPNPEIGPGLINGLKYYYTVTAYDINSPFAPGGSSLESGQRLSEDVQDVGGAAAVPRPDATNFVKGGFTVKMIGGDGSTLNPDAPIPAIDAEGGQFAGPMPPTNGFTTAVEPFIPHLVTAAATATVTIDSIVPGNPAAHIAAVYHVTADGPAGRQSISAPIQMGYTDDGPSSVTLGFDLLRASNDFSNRYGTDATGQPTVDPNLVKLTGASTVTVPDAWSLASIARGWVNGQGVAWNGPRWFVSGQSEPADPNAGLGDWWCGNDEGCAVPGGLTGGAVPGYEVVLIAGYATTTSRIRTLEGELSTVRRAADIEVTWGANGKPSKVYDLTHKVDVPYSPNYRASYGFLTLASFDGVDPTLTFDKDNNVITASDWECVSPHNEWTVAGEVEFVNCPSPVSAKLADAAALAPISWTSGNFNDTSTPQQGFAMYINGALFFFFGDALPPEGAKWTLRTYTGSLDAESVVSTDGVMQDVRGYAYNGGTVRPPAVPGLRAEISLQPSLLVAEERSLDNVHTVPDPFYVSSGLQSTSAQRKLQFVNLPERAVIRIYSLAGVLVDAIDHNDPTGGGTAEWDLRNRNNQYVASGMYFYHVQTPDGKAKIGKFVVIQAP